MQVIDLASLTWKQITRSPDEEWLARAARWGATEPVSDDFAAAFLMDHRVVTISPNGIRFQLHNREHLFWQEDSLTLLPNHVGQQRTVRFDPDTLDCVHVFERVGESIRYVETIAKHHAPGMLDTDACAQVLAAKNRQARRVLAELEELKRPEIAAETQRVLTNAEKIQHVRTFPLPASNLQSSADQNSLIISGDATARPSTRAITPPGVELPRASSSTPDAPVSPGATASRHTVPPVSTFRLLRTEASAPDPEGSEAARLTDGRTLPSDRQTISEQIATGGRRASAQRRDNLDEADARRARERARIQRLATVLEDY